jgi:predicted ArsR family transcriptional regulator
VRRRLYAYVAGAGRPVGRDEAAEAAGVRRALAAYHLDKLAKSGLLEVSYERRAGRSGPGAGRPAKLYRRPDHGFVSRVPPRDYRLLAEILVEAAEGRPLEDVARAKGRQLAPKRPDADVLEVLRSGGYEPFADDDGVLRLRNCPFDSIAAEHPDLVCGLNLALVEGLLEGAEAHLEVRLAPAEGLCCVAIERRVRSVSVRS